MRALPRQQHTARHSLPASSPDLAPPLLFFTLLLLLPLLILLLLLIIIITSRPRGSSERPPPAQPCRCPLPWSPPPAAARACVASELVRVAEGGGWSGQRPRERGSHSPAVPRERCAGTLRLQSVPACEEAQACCGGARASGR
eukprot:1159980-Rhodomonas_salina.1